MAPKIPNKKPVKELYQQCVLELRPEDQFVVYQNGSEKRMLVASFRNAIINLMANKFEDMLDATPLPAHTHAEGDVDNLSTDIANFIAALGNKAALNHTHLVTDVQNNFGDLTGGAPIAAYSGTYCVIAKATVAAGNAVFQFTANGLAGGATVFPNGPLPNSELFRAEEGTNPIATGVAVWSNGNKTLTVPVSRVGTAVTILGLSVLGATVQANGTVVYATVRGR